MPEPLTPLASTCPVTEPLTEEEIQHGPDSVVLPYLQWLKDVDALKQPAEPARPEGLDLALLKGLCAKATPGPWYRPDDLPTLVECGGTKHSTVCGCSNAPRQRGENDAAFIAAARTAIPLMIEYIESLEAALGRKGKNAARDL